MPFDPYHVLGVGRDASDDEIRQAYRALARRYHPDLNQTVGAEERFKQLGQALAVLTDATRRQLYDRYGEASLQLGFEPPEPGAPARGAGQRRRPPARPATAEGHPARPATEPDVVAEVEIDLLTAVTGGEIRATSPLTGAPVQLSVPRDARSGDQLRLAGRGRPGHGGQPGDLIFELQVRPHPFFRRQGRDLVLELPLTIDEAHHGAPIQIPTLDGWAQIRIPPGSRGGERLRLRGKGPWHRSGRGDLYVHLCVRLPDRLDALGRALDRVGALYTTPVRQGLKL